MDIQKTISYIKSITDFVPDVGIILGSGLGSLGEELQKIFQIDYSSIPDFPVSTVKGHTGKLIFGILGGKKVVAMQGRFHYYEGYSMKEVTYPVQVMKELGIHTLLLSNACGGVNPSYRVGDLMIIEDHINFIWDNPLIGQNNEKWGPRFPDMSAPYDPVLISKAKKITEKHAIPVKIGVYAAVSGPCFETRAEIRFLRIIGADVIGMSTIPEVIAARHRGIACFGLSIITDVSSPDVSVKVTHEEVLEAANKAAPKMTTIFRELIEGIGV